MHGERPEVANQYGKGGQARTRGELAIIGLGHVGLPLWLVFSSCHVRCVGVDKNASRIEEIVGLSGRLDEVVRASLARHLEQEKSARSRLVTRLTRPMGAILVAVECKSEAVLCQVIDEVLPWLEPGGVLMIASTCQPDWFAGVVSHIGESGRVVGQDLLLAHTPERLMPGEGALDEVRQLPRVIGGHTAQCAAAAARHYARVTRAELIEQVSLEEAALIKIAENAYRAINVVLANEIEAVAHGYGMDVARVMRLANTHPRVALHQPGAGAWGRCLPLAMELLASEGSELARVAHALNARRPAQLVDRLLHALHDAHVPLDRAVVVVAGLAYKRGQHDAREGAGTLMVSALLERGVGRVRVCDPHVEDDSLRIVLALDPTRVQVCVSLEEAIQGAHGVVVSVRHEAFDAPLRQIEELDARGERHPEMCAPAAWVFAR